MQLQVALSMLVGNKPTLFFFALTMKILKKFLKKFLAIFKSLTMKNNLNFFQKICSQTSPPSPIPTPKVGVSLC